MYHVIDRKIQMITVNCLNFSIFKLKKKLCRSESDNRHLSNVTKFQSNAKFNFRTVLITMYSASLHAINSVVTQFNFYPHERQLFQTKMSQYSQKIRLPKKWRQKKSSQSPTLAQPETRWLLRKIGNAIIAMDFNIF